MARDRGRDTGERSRLCPACRSPISIFATICRFCGQKVDRPRDDGRRLTVSTLGESPGDSYVPLGSVDLVRAAREGHVEPALYRDAETSRMIELLYQERDRRNVLVVGQAGVGKTKFVRGVALAISEGVEDGTLPLCRLLELNLSLLESGTVNMMDTVIALGAMIQEMPGLFVFVDGLHPLLDVEVGNDAAESVLASSIRTAEMGYIATLNLDEYEHIVDRDANFFFNFNVLRLEPLSVDSSVEILRARRPLLEKQYNLRISERALKPAVTLSQRYLTGQCLPGKAVDVLTKACHLYRQRLIAQSNYPAEWLDETALGPMGNEIGPEHVKRAITDLTSIDVDAAEAEVWKTILEERLRQFVVGQDEAITQIAATMSRVRLRLGEGYRPAGVMMFGGPRGVGKFMTIRALAYKLTGSYDGLNVFDMSKYSDVSAVTKLFGLTPWQDANPATGALARAVHRAPFAIVFFNGIEHVHQSFFDALLPILTTGSLRDSGGHEVRFNKCVLVLSYNCAPPPSYDCHTPDSLREVLLKRISREVVGRFDAIVPFKVLDATDLHTIIRFAMRELQRRVKPLNIAIRIYDMAYVVIGQQGYTPENGAADLLHTLDRLVIRPINKMIEAKEVKGGDTLEVLAESGQINIRAAHPQPGPTETPQP